MPEATADLFRIEGRYLRSVNLERDFSDPQALNAYVLTPQVKQYLERMVTGLSPSSGRRAWRVTGDYGAGKSSYALALSRLLSGERKHLPKDIREAVNFRSIGARPDLLPVLMTGSKAPLSASLLRSLKQAIMGQALSGRRLGVLAKIEAALSPAENGIPDEITVNLITETADSLRHTGRASGLLIVIDELGKLLEYAAHNPDRQDVFLLQRLAEVAARSGGTPIFVVGLLHQGFSAYADTLSPSAQKEWEKVAGRFEEIAFSQPLDQTALLVSRALGVNTARLPRARLAEIKNDLSATIDLGWYGAACDRKWLKEIVAGIFPLHPTVLPIVVNLFRRFGQNERSLFGFLLQEESFGLFEFARRQTASEGFYRLHHLYDYARANFGHRLGAQSYRSHWNLIDSIIGSYPADEPLETQILKTVGLLNLLDEQHLLASDEAIRLAVIGNNQSAQRSFDKALKRLRADKQVIYLRGASGGWCLWPYTSVNLEKLYADADRAVGWQNLRVSSNLVERLEDRPLVARRHYIETGNLRHFEVRYLPVGELDAIPDADFNRADGWIVVALCEAEEERRSALRLARSDRLKHRPELLLAVPRPLNTLSNLLSEALRWEWVERDTPELQHDQYAREEVSRQKEAARQALNKTIAGSVGLRQFSGKTEMEWYCQGQLLKIGDGRELLERLSRICDEIYHSAPRVKNELINRRSLSSAAAAARMRLLEGIFSKHNEPLLGMNPDKKPPEMSMYLSILKAGNIHKKTESGWALREPEETNDTLNLLPALRHLRGLLESRQDSRVRVAELLAELRRPPFGIRDGLGVVLLMAFAVIHEPHVAFYEDGVFRHKTAGLDVMHLVKVMDKYEIQYYRIAGIRAALFEEIMKLLELPGRSQPQLLDVVRPLCVFAAGLPKYVQRTTHLSMIARQVRDALLNAREPATLLFRELPEACSFEPFKVEDHQNDRRVRTFIGVLKGAVDELRAAYTDLLQRLRNAIHRSFDLPDDAGDFRERLALRAQEIVETVTEPSLKSFCLRLRDRELPDHEWLESVGSLLCSLPPSRWADADEGKFIQELGAVAARFKRIESLNFKTRGKLNPQSAIRIAITRPDGTEVDQVIFFSQVEEARVAEVEERIAKIITEADGAGLAAAARAFWRTLGRL